MEKNTFARNVRLNFNIAYISIFFHLLLFRTYMSFIFFWNITLILRQSVQRTKRTKNLNIAYVSLELLR